MRYDDPYEGIDPLSPDRDKAGKLEPVCMTRVRLAAGAMTVAVLAIGAVLAKDVSPSDRLAVTALPFATRDAARCAAHKPDQASCSAKVGEDSAPSR